jgi:hypothetical protein
MQRIWCNSKKKAKDTDEALFKSAETFTLGETNLKKLQVLSPTRVGLRPSSQFDELTANFFAVRLPRH